MNNLNNSSEFQSFLQSIIATPEDDTPRLIFADWLEEHGDSDRAEFIRLQCELFQVGKGLPVILLHNAEIQYTKRDIADDTFAPSLTNGIQIYGTTTSDVLPESLGTHIEGLGIMASELAVCLIVPNKDQGVLLVPTAIARERPTKKTTGRYSFQALPTVRDGKVIFYEQLLDDYIVGKLIREQKLLDRKYGEWITEVHNKLTTDPVITGHWIQRGFVYKVRMTTEAFQLCYHELIKVAPIQEVELISKVQYEIVERRDSYQSISLVDSCALLYGGAGVRLSKHVVVEQPTELRKSTLDRLLALEYPGIKFKYSFYPRSFREMLEQGEGNNLRDLLEG